MNGSCDYESQFHLVAFRGLRRGEVAGLRWCGIDLKAGLMFISQQTQRGGVGRQRTAQDPKTPGSEDWVVLDRVSVEVLEIHTDGNCGCSLTASVPSQT